MSSKVDCKVVLLGRSYAGKTCLTTRFLEGYFYANQVPYRTVDMKVVLLGREYGGKTSLVERFMYDRFAGAGIPYQATIGAAFGAKKVNVNGENVMLGIWDTAGSERYEAMSRIYYRGACAAIVCYDLTDADSWQRTQFWVKELQQNEEDCKIYLCGTKKDLVEDDKHRRKVDYHTVTDYADEINAKVFETSSKTGEKIVELFEQIAQDYITDPKVRSASLEDTITPMDERSSKRGGGGGCCGR